MNLGADIVLVTGAEGWFGLSLVTALAQGLPEVPALAEPQRELRIRCLALPGGDHTELKAISNRVEVTEGDLRNPDACRRLCEGARGAVLFHTAGVIHPGRVAEFYDVNLKGTENILDAAIAAGVRRAVITSSNSPCGCNPHPDHLFNEDSPYHPYMNYGSSKMLMERAARKRHDAGKIELVILRPPWFYGPRQPARQTLFFQMIRDGKAPIVGGGGNLRSMAYMDNLAQGHILAATSPGADGKVYWIADERPYSMNEIVDTVERLLETEFGYTCAHKRLRLPGVVSDVAQGIDWTIQRLGLYHQKFHVLSEMNKTIACSVDRAREELGYRPTIALEEGMRRSIAWAIDRYGRF